jgi:hypothetical protein
VAYQVEIAQPLSGVEERRAVEETADGKSVVLGFGYFATQFSNCTVRELPHVPFALLCQSLYASRQSSAQLLGITVGKHGVCPYELPRLLEGFMDKLFHCVGDRSFHDTHAEPPRAGLHRSLATSAALSTMVRCQNMLRRGGLELCGTYL